MSEENVELLKGILSAYEGVDFAALTRDTVPADLRAAYEAVYHPDIEIIWVDTSPDSGPFHGIDEAMRVAIFRLRRRCDLAPDRVLLVAAHEHVDCVVERRREEQRLAIGPHRIEARIRVAHGVDHSAG